MNMWHWFFGVKRPARRRNPVRRNLDAFIDARGVVHPIRRPSSLKQARREMLDSGSPTLFDWFLGR